MPAVVRLGDLCSGHSGYPPRASIEASTNVYVNNKGVVRVGDKFAIHCSGDCHDGTQQTGSAFVFVNGKAMARVNDTIDCGSTDAQGSDNVFCNA